MELNRNQSPNSDRLVVGGTLALGGTLRVALAPGAPSPQANDVYQLFSKGGSGTFTSVILPDISGLPGGLTWNTTNLAVNGTLSVNGQATPPSITTVSSSGTNLVFGGTGGTPGNGYIVLSSTNIALPMASWTPVATNVFDSGGAFSVTNGIDPAQPAMFFTVKLQ